MGEIVEALDQNNHGKSYSLVTGFSYLDRF